MVPENPLRWVQGAHPQQGKQFSAPGGWGKRGDQRNLELCSPGLSCQSGERPEEPLGGASKKGN